MTSAPLAGTVAWLMEGDPSIRWQVVRDLVHGPADTVAAERSRIASEGWGAHLLSLQRPDGNWGDGVSVPHWVTNLFTLLLLRNLGLDPSDARARSAIELVHEKIDWGEEFGHSPFFEGEVEPCINGGTLALGAYFGHPSARLAGRLLEEQLPDGGWNCEAERGSTRSSFHTTICVLEGLLEYQGAAGPSTAVTDAQARAHEYLLERRLHRKLSSGEVIDPGWSRFPFPTRWQYDLLRGLDYLRRAGVPPTERAGEAVAVVAGRRRPDGRWPIDEPHPGTVHVGLEGEAGEPSRWNTLRALRVLGWYPPAA